MRGAAWAAIVCAAIAGGCRTFEGLANPFAGSFGTTAAAARGTALLPEVLGDGPFVDSVLIERPVGDAAIDRELWEVDRAAVAPEVAARLAENGLRVAVHRGTPSPALHRLLQSEPDLVNPHRLTFVGRKHAVIPTAGPYDTCEYQLLADLADQRQPVTLQQARCGVQVRPEATPEGALLLHCEPQIQHGERHEWLRPTADATQFVREGEVPTAGHPTLRFRVELDPNDTLLIGSSAAAMHSLGAVMFGAEANGRPRQRVLVVRAGRLGERGPDLPPIRGLHGRASIAAEAGKR